MSIQQKSWTKLGLATALAAGLAGTACSPGTDNETPASAEAPAATPDVTDPDVAASGSSAAQVGDPGEGGEGEGGVSIAQAGTDPVVFRSALAITEAHFLAGRDAYAAGFTDAAGEMFAHPVSEVLADMEGVLRERGVEDFTDLLLDASDAAYRGAPQADIDRHVDGVIAALRTAADKAPDNGMDAGAVAARVTADQIDRAADMYGVAQRSDAYEPYLDGYGFYKAALAVMTDNRTRIEASDADAVSDLEAALTALGRAYPTATRPETLDENAAQLAALASRAMLSLG
ncbi:hypothetical protein [uncultured Algimonas sp.]|uniref:hypothetical protein n=1 Tax=uncultured Algimonas sp. TaxID=1547920 RepID=UPI002611DE37|nr:hypothetical protein [uncultured Algimonas sp.]